MFIDKVTGKKNELVKYFSDVKKIFDFYFDPRGQFCVLQTLKQEQKNTNLYQ